jgi:hypothetical protein
MNSLPFTRSSSELDSISTEGGTPGTSLTNDAQYESLEWYSTKSDKLT